MASAVGIGAPDPKPRVQTWLETGLKVLTGGLGLVAAIGLPAIAVQMYRYGVPIGTVGYNHIILAGTLPALALTLVAAYCVAALRTLSRIGFRAFIGLHSLLLIPVLIPVYLLVLAGALCYLLIVAWVILWTMHLLVEAWLPIQIGNRALLIAAAVSVVLIAIGVAIYQGWRRVWAPAATAPNASVEPAVPNTRATPANATASPTTNGTSTAEDRWEEFSALGTIASISVSFLGMLYCVKAALFLWDPAWGGLFRHRDVLGLSLIGGIVTVLFVGGMLLLEARKTHSVSRPHKIWLAIIGAIVFLLFESLYCTHVYPRLYPGLGGGKPISITMWLRGDDEAEDVRAQLPGVQICQQGRTKRVENAYVLLDTGDRLLLTDVDRPPGTAVLIDKGRVIGAAWNDSRKNCVNDVVSRANRL